MIGVCKVCLLYREVSQGISTSCTSWVRGFRMSMLDINREREGLRLLDIDFVSIEFSEKLGF